MRQIDRCAFANERRESNVNGNGVFEDVNIKFSPFVPRKLVIWACPSSIFPNLHNKITLLLLVIINTDVSSIIASEYFILPFRLTFVFVPVKYCNQFWTHFQTSWFSWATQLNFISLTGVYLYYFSNCEILCFIFFLWSWYARSVPIKNARRETNHVE